MKVYRSRVAGAARAYARRRTAGDVWYIVEVRQRSRCARAARNPKGAGGLRARASLLVVDDAQDIDFLLAPSARIAIPTRAALYTFTTGS